MLDVFSVRADLIPWARAAWCQMDAARPLISVIIPHLDQPDSLEACLASLEVQTLDKSLFEIIVVDNGSKCHLEELMSRHPSVRFLHEGTPGPGPARNLGAAKAAAEIYCFIDADCRAHRDWLSAALGAFSSVSAGTILGGDVQIWRDNPRAWTAIQAYESIFGYRQKLHIEYYGFSGSGNLAVRKTDFDRVGPFRGIEIAEDKEWGIRARARGLSFKYIPNMIVYHPARPSLRQLCTQWDRLIQHALTMERKRKHWRLFWLGRAFAVGGSPLVDAIEVMKSDRIDGLSSRFGALAVLAIIRSYRAWRMMTVMWGPRRSIVWNRDVAIDIAEQE